MILIETQTAVYVLLQRYEQKGHTVRCDPHIGEDVDVSLRGCNAVWTCG